MGPADTVTGQIIGVVGSVRWGGLATAPEATTYFWFPQNPGRFTMLVLVAFAATALLLAMIGLYGLISFIVVQRTHEIGVRMALGAQQRDVLRLVMYGGLRLALAGIAIGVGATVAITRVMAGLIYGVRPTDPITLVTVTSVVTAVALFATYVPGRRATRLDPTVALGE